MNNNYLQHYGVKGQKWGVINEHDVNYEKNRLKYDTDKYKAKLEYKTAKLDIKKGNSTERYKAKAEKRTNVELAKIQKTIEDGREWTDRIVSFNQTRAEKYKYDAQMVTAVSASLAVSSLGKSFARTQKYKAEGAVKVAEAQNEGNKFKTVNVKNDNRVDNRAYNGNYSVDNHSIKSNTEKTAIIKMKHSEEDYVSIGETLLTNLIDENEDVIEHAGKGHLQGGRSGRKPYGMGLYVNPDGSLTEAGKLRYYPKKVEREREIKMKKDAEALKNAYDNALKEGKITKEQYDNDVPKISEIVKDKVNEEKWETEAAIKIQKDSDKYALDTIATGQNVLKGITDTMEGVTKIIPNVPGKDTHPDYSDISTEELKKRTDRLNTEYNYAKASGQLKHVPSSQEKARERLQTIGAVSGILATVIGGVVIPIAKHRRSSGGGD